MTPFLFISLLMLTIWVFVLLLSEDTRREQIVMSIIGLVLSPAVLLLAASGQPWSDLLSLSYGDFLFSFALFGIAAVIFQAVTGKQAEPIKRRRRRLKNRALHWLAHLLVAGGIWLFTSLLASLFFDIYPGQAFLLGGLLIGIYVIADRRDLMVNAVFSGLFIALLIFTLEKVFLLKLFPDAALTPLSLGEGAALAGVPWSDLAWAAIVGFTVGPLYEYARRLRLK